MAFLAVIREGLGNRRVPRRRVPGAPTPPRPGAARSSASWSPSCIGFAIYRGGVQINLARFFRVTGLVLVLVAAGLSRLGSTPRHEAGWINPLQGQAVDLSWLVQPGTIRASLLTGVLGLQPTPTVGEALVSWRTSSR